MGQGDKNQDLMNEYQVPMQRGIPAIAVLDASGKVIYSQKNGEFERARAIGPEDLLEFLKKWKPQARWLLMKLFRCAGSAASPETFPR